MRWCAQGKGGVLCVKTPLGLSEAGCNVSRGRLKPSRLPVAFSLCSSKQVRRAGRYIPRQPRRMCREGTPLQVATRRNAAEREIARHAFLRVTPEKAWIQLEIRATMHTFARPGACRSGFSRELFRSMRYAGLALQLFPPARLPSGKRTLALRV
jgi:hypothetical protein